MGFGRAVALVVSVLVVLRSFWFAEPYALVQSVNLVFHEAGHVIFSPLGRLWSVAGGSLFEVGLPATLALLAMRQRQWSALGGCLVWMGTALQSVSVYAGDAQARALPLVGGQAVIHDWWYLLRHFGALSRDAEVAALLWSGGLAAALIGLCCLVAGVVQAAPRGDRG
ncbi:hypothetical protein [Oceanibium sediminis]|uniref:hypothetical protein n=1 Tax=Oceanibium sediminis TaxID=2026339 RepID=UPI000DD2B8BF|nr:hypothetical protein [Oceanibium sediminis]